MTVFGSLIIRLIFYLIIPFILVMGLPSVGLVMFLVILLFVIPTDIMYFIKRRIVLGKWRLLIYSALPLIFFFVFKESVVVAFICFLDICVADFLSWAVRTLKTSLGDERQSSGNDRNLVNIDSKISQSQEKATYKVNSIESIKSYTPQEFFQVRKTSRTFPGVYILYNHTKNMFYVGQAKNVLRRVNSHFTGKGNGDVYADYKYGDSFTIRLLPLCGSGFSNLDDFEREMIDYFNAYGKGYNKTKGNGRHH